MRERLRAIPSLARVLIHPLQDLRWHDELRSHSSCLVISRILSLSFLHGFHLVNGRAASAMGRYVKGSWTAAVDVLTWFLLVASVLSVLTRLGTKFWIFRRLTRDDHLSILSLVGFPESWPSVLLRVLVALCCAIHRLVRRYGSWLWEAFENVKQCRSKRHDEGMRRLFCRPLVTELIAPTVTVRCRYSFYGQHMLLKVGPDNLCPKSHGGDHR